MSAALNAPVRGDFSEKLYAALDKAIQEGYPLAAAARRLEVPCPWLRRQMLRRRLHTKSDDAPEQFDFEVYKQIERRILTEESTLAAEAIKLGLVRVTLRARMVKLGLRVVRQKAADRVSRKSRKMLELRNAGMSVAQIAERFNMPRNNVSVNISIARRRIRETAMTLSSR